MGYFLLFLTVVTDILATWLLKLSAGLCHHLFVFAAILVYIISKAFFGLTLEKIPLGYAYAVWCGFGTLLACLLGNWQFKESFSPVSLLGIFLIIAGIGCLEFGKN